jgi:DNA polymerase-3 subunit alpha (Gram-positive type)
MLKANALCLPWLEQLSKLEKATGVAARTIPLDDPRMYALFSGDDVEGLPDFDNEIVAKVMHLLQPRNFCELVKGIGMLHGTNVWSENGEYLLADGVPLAALPATRDDIFNDIARVSDRETAYRYSEGIRKNFFEKGKFTEEDTARFAEITRPLGDWYVAYCTNIRYMFPKAHAAEYALATLRLAWFKKYYPEQFRDVLAEKA